MSVEAAPGRRNFLVWVAGLPLAACIGCCALTLVAQLILPQASRLVPGFVVNGCLVRGTTTAGRPRATVLWMPPEGLKLIPPASRPRTVCVYLPWLPALPQSGGFNYPR